MLVTAQPVDDEKQNYIDPVLHRRCFLMPYPFSNTWPQSNFCNDDLALYFSRPQSADRRFLFDIKSL